MECPTVGAFDTQLPADCVEALPADRTTLLCGTYRLVPRGEGGGGRPLRADLPPRRWSATNIV